MIMVCFRFDHVSIELCVNGSGTGGGGGQRSLAAAECCLASSLTLAFARGRARFRLETPLDVAGTYSSQVTTAVQRLLGAMNNLVILFTLSPTSKKEEVLLCEPQNIFLGKSIDLVLLMWFHFNFIEID